MTTTLIDAAQLTREWPEDLRPIVGERRLVELAREAAHVVSQGLPRPAIIPEAQPRSPRLLTLLTYCYAAGIYGSEEIEWACENDVSVRYLCAKTWPDAETLRRFRRANRPWIEACLARVYGSACPPKETSANLRAFLQRKIEVAIMTDTAIADGY